MKTTLHIGQTLIFGDSPFEASPEESAVHESRAGVLVVGGRIAATGSAEDLRRSNPHAQVLDHGRRLILPGFIDAHAHFPQTAIIASWGKRLIDWLNTYTFPEEARFGDPAYAAAIAATYLDLCLANGITTAASYCTIHPESVDALFEAAETRGLRWVAGKVMMDRNAPVDLRDTAQSGYDFSKALLNKWHNRARMTYAITPRFAPTSSHDQLEAAGALWSEFPNCPMQTHLCEQIEEIAWVRELYPDARDYFDVYQRAGLAGPGAVMGHAIHLGEREWQAIADTGTHIAHCPTSNTFIGSGLFDMARAQTASIPTGLATDVGGGSSFSMLRTMAAAYEISQLRGAPLHPAQLIWLATQGSAQSLRLEDRIGSIAVGMEADLITLDLASTPAIAQRQARAETIWEAVFPTIMMGDDRAVQVVSIAG
ncbi:guanine deaminase [Algicella marina]|uniref:Guanine deaminase n=1 Tax=Algicella marina TaxID=2683284 RepID=A0A6P1SXY5_9RHOB|nr:guanine deaminase [Algicella marina]QHQ35544.1 guanine deaminase [Algicella marina]